MTGPWSLPFGIMLPWLGAFCIGIALLMQLIAKPSWVWVCLGGINACILLEDLRFKRPEASGFPVMSWNLATPQTKEMNCIIPELKVGDINTPTASSFFKKSQNATKREIRNGDRIDL